MNWKDIIIVRFTENNVLSLEIGFVLPIILAVAIIILLIYRRKRFRLWSPVEAELNLGSIGKVKIRPSYEDIQIDGFYTPYRLK